METFQNARLLYISVDGLHYSSGGQVILTVTCFYMPLALVVPQQYSVCDQVILTNNFGVASLLDRLDSELHIATETEQDRTRLLLLQYFNSYQIFHNSLNLTSSSSKQPVFDSSNAVLEWLLHPPLRKGDSILYC